MLLPLRRGALRLCRVATTTTTIAAGRLAVHGGSAKRHASDDTASVATAATAQASGGTTTSAATTAAVASPAVVRTASPPAWLSQLRADAAAEQRSISYDIKIYDELAWRRRPFVFDKELWHPHEMSTLLRRRLCLGDELAEYTVVGEAMPFADRDDAPVVNAPQCPCRLLWDHRSATEKILIQLAEHFPPLLWHTVRPTLSALKKVFAEYLDVDAAHMKRYLPMYEDIQHRLETATRDTVADGTLSPSYMKEAFIHDMRSRDPRQLELDYGNEHTVYLGTTAHFRLLEDDMMKRNAFVFGWPLLLSDGNAHLEDTPLRTAAFRTIYSKSLLLFHTRLDLQVDHRLTRLPGDAADVDVAEESLLEVPVFCTVNYASNTRLCGGRALVQRYNDVMGTAYPLDTPTDVLGALARQTCVKTPAQLMEELRFLDAAARRAPSAGPERVFRAPASSLATHRILGQLAYTIIYLALVNHPEFVRDVYDVYAQHESDLVRVACAKGAHIVGRHDLVEQLVAREPAGRCRDMLCATMATCNDTLACRHAPRSSNADDATTDAGDATSV